jgi:SAM-dependent methyltransferase
MRVAESNERQAQIWDGGDGDYWTEQELIFDRSVAGYRRRLLTAAAIARADRVLDLGCGTGQVTRDAARRAPDGHALGVDLSSRMIERARKRAADEGLANASFEQGDAQVHPFAPATFDLAVSRTSASFFGDPEAAFVNVAAALKPGGRLVLLNWQSVPENPWFAEFTTALGGMPPLPPDAPSPFALGDADRTRRLLIDAGFVAVEAVDVRAPMYFGRDPDEAHRFMSGLGVARMLLRGRDPAEREQGLAALRATVEAHATSDGVLFPSAAWLVMARRP